MKQLLFEDLRVKRFSFAPKVIRLQSRYEVEEWEMTRSTSTCSSFGGSLSINVAPNLAFKRSFGAFQTVAQLETALIECLGHALRLQGNRLH